MHKSNCTHRGPYRSVYGTHKFARDTFKSVATGGAVWQRVEARYPQTRSVKINAPQRGTQRPPPFAVCTHRKPTQLFFVGFWCFRGRLANSFTAWLRLRAVNCVDVVFRFVRFCFVVYPRAHTHTHARAQQQRRARSGQQTDAHTLAH